MGDPDSLNELVEAIADRRAVDWNRAMASDASDRGLTAELRFIEEIARVHQSGDASFGGDSSLEVLAHTLSSRPATEPTLFEWGPLRVLERVGGGSFGEVFRAWETSMDREVALKLLRNSPSLESRTVASVIREGQLLARVRHPNVMAVYGAQQVDGRIGIWGEFLRGRTLARMVADDGPMSAQEAGIVLDGVCRAMTAVHRAGLLHRDIKAQNVMRVAGGRIVLMDFGLGREANLRGQVNEPELVGTPVYLAPELFRGEAASAQSDIYSAGVLLFHLLTGRFPVEGRTLSEIGRHHEAGRRTSLEELGVELPAPFTRVVERALQSERRARFESAGALQSALAETSQLALAAPQAPTLSWHWLGAGALAAAVAALGVYAATPDVPGEVSVAFALPPPEDGAFTDGSRNVPVISPDGRYVAFVATRNGVSELWLRDLAEQSPRCCRSLKTDQPQAVLLAEN